MIVTLRVTMQGLLKSKILNALDQARSACMVPYAQLKLVKTEGFKSILLFFKIFDFNKPSGNNQGHLKSSILTAVKIEDFKCALF